MRFGRLFGRGFRYFFFNATASTEIYTLSLHDALPISMAGTRSDFWNGFTRYAMAPAARARSTRSRSEEHTSELQSRRDLVCRLLLEKKKLFGKLVPRIKQKLSVDHNCFPVIIFGLYPL